MQNQWRNRAAAGSAFTSMKHGVQKRCNSVKEDVLFWSRKLFINCKPFYSLREFCSFILVSFYIHPQAHESLALQKLADQITDTEQKHPDSVLIILGDFNK